MMHKRLPWLIVAGTCIAVGLIVVATVQPHGLIAAVLTSAAAVATIVALVPPLVSSWAGRSARRGDGRAGSPAGASAVDLPQAPISSRNAHDLGVHPAAWASDENPGNAGLTPYLRRGHDVKLDDLIKRAADGGPSVFAVLVGSSTTGKTRALFEALNRNPSVRNWPLYHPVDAKELIVLVMQQRIVPGSVLWLDETQRYLYGKSGPEAARLIMRLVTATARIIVVGTMWLDYWHDLTRKGAPGDPNAAARDLLDRPERRIDVVDHLEQAQILELTTVGGGDQRVVSAVAAAGVDGQVIQNLTGGPELLARYVYGGLFNPAEHALITAALDIRRLGHQSPLSSQFLATAADGYIGDRERPDPQSWISTLAALADGERTDAHGSTTAVRTLTALIAHRARGQIDPYYEPNDFLDQHTRKLRQACLGPEALWDALVTWTVDPRDLYRLGDAAERRGLYKHAAQLWLRATACGDASSAVRLTWLVARTGDSQMLRDATSWIAGRANLADPSVGGQILDTFHRAGADDQLSIVADQIAATSDISDPRAVNYLLRRLGEAKASAQLLVLARRVSKYADVTDPRAVGYLIGRMRDSGLGDQLTQLVSRASEHTDLSNPQAVGSLIRELRRAGQNDGLTQLLARGPAKRADLSSLQAVSVLIDALRETGSSPQLTALGRRAAAQAHLADRAVSYLIEALAIAGLRDELTELTRRAAAQAELIDPSILGYLVRRAHGSAASGESKELARQAAAHANPTNPLAVSILIDALRETGTRDQAIVLADRTVSDCDLTDPRADSYLIDALAATGAHNQVIVLADRAVADCDLADPRAVSHLIRALREARTGDQMTALAERAATHADLANPAGVGRLIEQLRESGANKQLAVLFTRLTATDQMRNPEVMAYLIDALLRAKAGDQLAALLSSDLVAKFDLSDASAIIRLLDALSAANAKVQLAALSRQAAAHADVSSPQAVGNLIDALHRSRADDQITVLLSRLPEQCAELSDPEGVGILLDAFWQVRAQAQVAVLASRASKYADVSNPHAVARLVDAFTRVGAGEDLAVLGHRAAEHTDLTNHSAVTELIAAFRASARDEEARGLAIRAADAGVESAFETLIELSHQSPVTEHMRRYGREPGPLPWLPWVWGGLLTLSRMSQ